MVTFIARNWPWLLLVIALTGFSLYLWSAIPRIAYVNTSRLITGYHGMKEAADLYEKKMKTWQANLDTLQYEYKAEEEKLKRDFNQLTPQAKQATQALLAQKRADILRYRQALEENASREDSRISEEVYNQINSYIKTYAEKKGYDMVLGATDNGSIMYARESDDITDEILAILNTRYNGK